MEILKMTIILAYLTIACISDIRYRSVDIRLFKVAFIIGIVFVIIEKREFFDVMKAMIPGILLFIFSVITKEAIGKGDGLFIMATALFYPFKQNTLLLLTAIMLSGMMSGILLVFYRTAGKKADGIRLPFLCFYAPYIIYLELGRLY